MPGWKRASLLASTAALLVAAGPVRIGETRLPATLDPLALPGTVEERLGTLVYDRIFQRDPRSGAWTSEVVDADGATLRVRRGVRWHDGVPADADDVCFSVNTVLDRRAPAWWRGPASAGLLGCVVEGGAAVLTVRDGADWRASLQIPLIPRHVYGGRDPWFDSPVGRDPVGTGPWRAAGGSDGWTLHGGSGSVHRLRAIPAGDPLDAVHALERGDLDALLSVPPALVPELTAADGITVRWFDRRTVWLVALDTREGPTSDAHVRRALDLLLDREALRLQLIGVDPGADVQPCELVSGPFRRRSDDYNRGVPPTAHDEEAAFRELGEAGYVREAAGWVKGGAPLQIALGMPGGLDLDAKATLSAIRRQWELAGIRVAASELSTAGYAKALDGGGPALDALVMPWLVRSDDPPTGLVGTDGWANAFRWSDPQVDRALAAMADPDADRTTAAWDVHGMVADARPALFLWQWDAWAAFRDELAFTPLTPGTGLGALDRWKRAK